MRPEAVRLSKERPDLRQRCISGVVESSTFLGNCLHVQIRLKDGTACTAEVPQNGYRFEPGEAVHVSWHATDELRIGGQ